MKNLIIGLDVSTSVTGIVVLENNCNFDPKQHLMCYAPIELSKCKSFWDKTKILENEIENIRNKFAPEVTAIYVEEPMKRFATGLSSAQTVSALQRINGIACFIAYKTWSHTEPTYVSVTQARKAAGVRVVQTKKDLQQRNAKKQTFDHMMSNDLSHIQWPVKRNSGNPKDWVYDVTDAYVIAKGGMLLNK